MKKVFRMTALWMAAALVALSLCSCQALDDARANRGFYSDDHNEIDLNGTVYRLLDPGDNCMFYDDWMNPYGEKTSYYATEKDVPILLANHYGDMVYMNEDETILSTQESYALYTSYLSGVTDDEYTPLEDYQYGSIPCYVREDKYDAAKACVDTGILDHYYFTYYDYDQIDDESDDFDVSSIYDNSQAVMLSDDLSKTLTSFINTDPKEKIGVNAADYLWLSRCDSGLILTDSGNNSCCLLRSKDQYYFWIGVDTGMLWMEDLSVFPLSGKDAAEAKTLFEQYPDAVFSSEGFGYSDSDDLSPDDYGTTV